MQFVFVRVVVHVRFGQHFLCGCPLHWQDCETYCETSIELYHVPMFWLTLLWGIVLLRAPIVRWSLEHPQHANVRAFKAFVILASSDGVDDRWSCLRASSGCASCIAGFLQAAQLWGSPMEKPDSSRLLPGHPEVFMRLSLELMANTSP